MNFEQNSVMDEIQKRQEARGRGGEFQALQEKQKQAAEFRKGNKEYKFQNQLRNLVEGLKNIQLGIRAVTLAHEVSKVMPESALSEYLDDVVAEARVSSLISEIEQDRFGGTLPDRGQGSPRFFERVDMENIPIVMRTKMNFLFGLEREMKNIESQLDLQEGWYDDKMKGISESQGSQEDMWKEVEASREKRDYIAKLQKDIKALGGLEELRRLMNLNI